MATESRAPGTGRLKGGASFLSGAVMLRRNRTEWPPASDCVAPANSSVPDQNTIFLVVSIQFISSVLAWLCRCDRAADTSRDWLLAIGAGTRRSLRRRDTSWGLPEGRAHCS